MEWAVFDGTPDETIDWEDQSWAINRVQEYTYRKEFGLTKAEMAEEPLEDITINFKIMNLLRRREEREQSIAEAKARAK